MAGQQDPALEAKAGDAKGKKKVGGKGAAPAKAAGGPVFVPPQAQVLPPQPTVQVPRRFPGHFMPHRLCNHWNLQGWCKKAETCTFAHGIEELHPDVQAQLLQQKPGMPPPTVTKDGRLVVHGVGTASKPGKVTAVAAETAPVGYPSAQMQSALASLYGAQATSLLGSGAALPFGSAVTNFPFNLTPGTQALVPQFASQPGLSGLADLKEDTSDQEADDQASSSPGTPRKGRPAPAPLTLDDTSPAEGQAMMVRPLVSPSVAARYTTIRTQPMASPMRVSVVSRPLPSPISTGLTPTATAGGMSSTATSVAMAAISTPKATPVQTSLASPARVTAHFSVRTPTAVWPGSPTMISPAQHVTSPVPIDRSTLLQARQVAVRLDQGPPGLAMWAPTPTTKAGALGFRYPAPGYVSVAPRTPGASA